MSRKFHLISPFFVFFGLFQLMGQDMRPDEPFIRDRVWQSTSPERLFLHLNSNYLLAGETLLFQVYCLDRYDQLSCFSKVAYIELVDANGKAALQAKVGLQEGLGYGDIFVPSGIATGKYTLVAYTQWMRNWSVDQFFRTEITLINPFQAVDPDKATLGNFPAKWDVQFLPEGGELVAGVLNRMGFRVVDEQGNGIQTNGQILDDQGNPVIDFESLVHGLGRVEFTPRPGIEYRAKVSDSIGNSMTVSLPEASKTGIAIMVDQEIEYHRLTMHPVGVSGRFFLAVHARGQVLYSKSLELGEGPIIVDLFRKDLPPGISILTVFDSDGQPVAERLIIQNSSFEIRPQLLASKDLISNREKVDLEIRTGSPGVDGNLSVSVRRQDGLQGISPPTFTQYLLLTSELKGRVENPDYYLQDRSPMIDQALDNLMLVHGWRTFFRRWDDTGPGDPEFLPDYRGQVFTGKVIKSSDSTPVANQLVYLTVPGKDYLLYASRTNPNGSYFFITEEIRSTSQVVMTLPAGPESLKIVPDDGFLSDSRDFIPTRLKIDTNLSQELQERSIAAQIENAYFEVKRDSALGPSKYQRFYRRADKVYVLDDYTRFILMDEVFTELIGSVFIRKTEDGHVLKVKDYENKYIVFEENPLVLIDGIPILDIKQVIEYDPLNVETIEVVAHRFLYGPLDCKGIVSIETYHGNAEGLELSQDSHRLSLTGIQPRKEYFAPVYDAPPDRHSRIPDFRTQLCWNPKVRLNENGAATLSFYTSDLTGDFMVTVEGVLETGQPVSLQSIITVENSGI